MLMDITDYKQGYQMINVNRDSQRDRLLPINLDAGYVRPFLLVSPTQIVNINSRKIENIPPLLFVSTTVGIPSHAVCMYFDYKEIHKVIIPCTKAMIQDIMKKFSLDVNIVTPITKYGWRRLYDTPYYKIIIF